MKKLIPIILAMMLLLSGCYDEIDMESAYQRGYNEGKEVSESHDKFLYDDAYKTGYSDGIDAANNTSAWEGSRIKMPDNLLKNYEIVGSGDYQDGYEDGFTEGYWEGQADASDNSKIDNEYNLEKEYIKGYKCGYEAGYYDGEEGNPYDDRDY